MPIGDRVETTELGKRIEVARERVENELVDGKEFERVLKLRAVERQWDQFHSTK